MLQGKLFYFLSHSTFTINKINYKTSKLFKVKSNFYIIAVKFTYQNPIKYLQQKSTKFTTNQMPKNRTTHSLLEPATGLMDRFTA